MGKIKKRLIFLVGPTGIGKSAAAICLAKKINGEIISCDSMQVYRKMDIITSKALASERKIVKHHMLDILDPGKQYDVASYRKEALAVCDRIISKGKIPLFVGGSGLYYSILIDGLFERAGEDRLIRSKLNKEADKRGSSYLYKKLKIIDKQAAGKIHPNDTRRIIRALEVYLKTGKKISELQMERTGLGEEYEFKIFGLDMPRNALYEKVNNRVERMFDLGLTGEVKSLLRSKLSKTARSAIGINELKGFLKGNYGLEEAKDLIKRNSRNYAKRQFTWFRKDKRIKWIKINQKDSPFQIAKKIWKKLS
jgi:tRNA dimethylallyltransferase